MPEFRIQPLTYLFALLLTACANIPDNPVPIVGDQIVITNITAIDAANGVREKVDIVVNGKKITAVGKNLAASASEGATRIDGTGKYVIPGLWDAHVHLAYNPEIDHKVFFPLSLAYGVTYLRDTGGQLDSLAEARDIAASDAIVPDLYVSGPLVDGAKRVYAGQSDGYPNLSVGATNVDEAVVEVDHLAAQGVQFIKAYEMLAPDVFRAVVKRAQYHNLPVTAHSPLSMTARQAIESGVSDMQHLRNLEMDCVADFEMLLEERRDVIAADKAEYGGKLRSSLHRLQREKAVRSKDDASCIALIQLMKKNGVSQTPTLTISRFLSRKLYAEKRWQDSFSLMPVTVSKNWLERATRLSKRERTPRDIAYDKWLMMMVSDLNRAGVSILAGTDAPIGYLTPGVSLHEELAMLVEAGLTPLEAIHAATIAPASFLGIDDRQGTIAPMMKADLVLLNANPLTDIRNTTAIAAVVKDGKLLSRTMLDQYRDAPSKMD